MAIIIQRVFNRHVLNNVNNSIPRESIFCATNVKRFQFHAIDVILMVRISSFSLFVTCLGYGFRVMKIIAAGNKTIEN